MNFHIPAPLTLAERAIVLCRQPGWRFTVVGMGRLTAVPLAPDVTEADLTMIVTAAAHLLRVRWLITANVWCSLYTVDFYV